MKNLAKELLIGIEKDGSVIKDYSLLRSNGVAEKVFTEKNASKPYSWMGQVIAVAVEKIGDVPVGANVRQEYVRTGGTITIPQIVLDIPLNDVNNVLIEVHRTVWKNLIRQQENICKYCGHTSVMDIDLDRIQFLPEEASKLEKSWHEMTVKLQDGWQFEPPKVVGSNAPSNYENFRDIVFNQFTFRIPTLGDAIKHEKLANDTITFWRRIAFDCLQQIMAGEGSGNAGTELPIDVKKIFSTKIFDEILFAEDLNTIRTELREGPPMFPFYYLEECSNPNCKKETPISAELGDFFSA